MDNYAAAPSDLAMLAAFGRALRAPAVGRAVAPTLARAMATGPSKGGAVSDEMLDKLGSLSTQALVDGLWVMGWPPAMIEGARALKPGQKAVGELNAPPHGSVQWLSRPTRAGPSHLFPSSDEPHVVGRSHLLQSAVDRSPPAAPLPAFTLSTHSDVPQAAR
jgi:hypothetical protein